MKKYISAEMQIIKMSANDIIATSGDPHDEVGDGNIMTPGRGIWDEDYNGYNY